MKIGFAHPNKRNYSETFIRYHIEYLKPFFVLTGGKRPYEDQNGKSVFPFSEPIRVFIKRLIPALYAKVYTHYLAKYLLQQQPDVVIVEYGTTGAGIIDGCIKARIPLVVHFHGFDAFEKKTVESHLAEYQKIFRYAKAIVAVSRDMVERLVELGAPRDKVHFVSCGVKIHEFFGANPATSEKLAVAVGRFTGKKAPHLTIKAFDKVLETHPDVRLVMIGHGDLFNSCKKLVEDLQLRHAVQLLGIKKPDEVASYLRAARLFVQHSMFNPENNDSEGTPTSILEAAATGLPIVSTRHAGIKDAVEHGKTGYLVEEQDVENMAYFMSILFSDAALAAQMGEASREKMIKEYAIDLQTEKLLQVLKN